MGAINTLTKEINNKLYNNESDSAFDLFKEILKDKRDLWKLNGIKQVMQFAKEKDYKFLFTFNFADLLVIDTKHKQILMVWVSWASISEKEERNLFKWIERTRQSLEDEMLLEFGYQVNVLHIVNSEEESDLDGFSYENDRFYRTIPAKVNFEDYSPIDSSHITPENEKIEEVLQFCYEMAYSLSDMEPDTKDNKKEEKEEQQESDNKEIKESKFNILEIAPESFLNFLDNNMKAMESVHIDDMFNLSLHSVFVSDHQSKQDDLVNCFLHSLSPKGQLLENVDIIKYDILDVAELKTFKSFLKEQESNIVVIENLEAIINPYLNFKKVDIIRVLCQELDTNKENAFLLTITKKGWQHLIAEYPQLGVFFQNVFVFDKLNTTSLLNHFKAELEIFELSLSSEAENLVIDFFNYTQKSQNPQLFDFPMSKMLAKEARYYHAVRISKEKTENNSVVDSEDIENSIRDEYVLDVKYNLSEILAKLDKLTGLENVKSKIRDIAALVKINRLRNNNNTKSATPLSLNSVFIGNPGTGKTTVARYLGEVFKSIGALQKGHVVAVSRQDIVKRFIGHTEENFISIINKARGGILFIDEAYSLYNKDTDNDFGKDAINVLVDRLDDIREHTCVILSGYPGPMKMFMDANPGLASRFPTTIEFKDYSSEELRKIFMDFVHSENFYLMEGAENLVISMIEKLLENKDDHFGNGRSCRNMFEQLKLIQARRITYSEIDNSTNLNLFTTDDIELLLKEMNNPQQPKRQKLGYRIGNGS